MGAPLNDRDQQRFDRWMRKHPEVNINEPLSDENLRKLGRFAHTNKKIFSLGFTHFFWRGTNPLYRNKAREILRTRNIQILTNELKASHGQGDNPRFTPEFIEQKIQFMSSNNLISDCKVMDLNGSLKVKLNLFLRLTALVDGLDEGSLKAQFTDEFLATLFRGSDVESTNKINRVIRVLMTVNGCKADLQRQFTDTQALRAINAVLVHPDYSPESVELCVKLLNSMSQLSISAGDRGERSNLALAIETIFGSDRVPDQKIAVANQFLDCMSTNELRQSFIGVQEGGPDKAELISSEGFVDAMVAFMEKRGGLEGNQQELFDTWVQGKNAEIRAAENVRTLWDGYVGSKLKQLSDLSVPEDVIQTYRGAEEPDFQKIDGLVQTLRIAKQQFDGQGLNAQYTHLIAQGVEEEDFVTRAARIAQLGGAIQTKCAEYRQLGADEVKAFQNRLKVVELSNVDNFNTVSQDFNRQRWDEYQKSKPDLPQSLRSQGEQAVADGQHYLSVKAICNYREAVKPAPAGILGGIKNKIIGNGQEEYINAAYQENAEQAAALVQKLGEIKARYEAYGFSALYESEKNAAVKSSEKNPSAIKRLRGIVNGVTFSLDDTLKRFEHLAVESDMGESLKPIYRGYVKKDLNKLDPKKPSFHADISHLLKFYSKGLADPIKSLQIQEGLMQEAGIAFNTEEQLKRLAQKNGFLEALKTLARSYEKALEEHKSKVNTGKEIKVARALGAIYSSCYNTYTTETTEHSTTIDVDAYQSASDEVKNQMIERCLEENGIHTSQVKTEITQVNGQKKLVLKFKNLDPTLYAQADDDNKLRLMAEAYTRDLNNQARWLCFTPEFVEDYMRRPAPETKGAPISFRMNRLAAFVDAFTKGNPPQRYNNPEKFQEFCLQLESILFKPGSIEPLFKPTVYFYETYQALNKDGELTTLMSILGTSQTVLDALGTKGKPGSEIRENFLKRMCAYYLDFIKKTGCPPELAALAVLDTINHIEKAGKKSLPDMLKDFTQNVTNVGVFTDYNVLEKLLFRKMVACAAQQARAPGFDLCEGSQVIWDNFYKKFTKIDTKLPTQHTVAYVQKLTTFYTNQILRGKTPMEIDTALLQANVNFDLSKVNNQEVVNQLSMSLGAAAERLAPREAIQSNEVGAEGGAPLDHAKIGKVLVENPLHVVSTLLPTFLSELGVEEEKTRSIKNHLIELENAGNKVPVVRNVGETIGGVYGLLTVFLGRADMSVTEKIENVRGKLIGIARRQGQYIDDSAEAEGMLKVAIKGLENTAFTTLGTAVGNIVHELVVTIMTAKRIQSQTAQYKKELAALTLQIKALEKIVKNQDQGKKTVKMEGRYLKAYSNAEISEKALEELRWRQSHCEQQLGRLEEELEGNPKVKMAIEYLPLIAKLIKPVAGAAQGEGGLGVIAKVAGKAVDVGTKLMGPTIVRKILDWQAPALTPEEKNTIVRSVLPLWETFSTVITNLLPNHDTDKYIGLLSELSDLIQSKDVDYNENAVGDEVKGKIWGAIEQFLTEAEHYTGAVVNTMKSASEIYEEPNNNNNNNNNA